MRRLLEFLLCHPGLILGAIVAFFWVLLVEMFRQMGGGKGGVL